MMGDVVLFERRIITGIPFLSFFLSSHPVPCFSRDFQSDILPPQKGKTETGTEKGLGLGGEGSIKSCSLSLEGGVDRHVLADGIMKTVGLPGDEEVGETRGD
jgi:hypothetical protein